MKKRLKITEGKFTTTEIHEPLQRQIGVNSYNPYTTETMNVCSVYGRNDKEIRMNSKLIADAFNTANETQLLPSELKEQRDELLKALSIANAMITHVGCVQGYNKGVVQVGEDEIEQCQWCYESSIIKNIINKIKDNE